MASQGPLIEDTCATNMRVAAAERREQRYPVFFAVHGIGHNLEHKGRQRELMEKIPAQHAVFPEPGLSGASLCPGEVS